jgi:hypothetical protein
MMTQQQQTTSHDMLSLPYIDHITADEKQQIDAMIVQEMNESGPMTGEVEESQLGSMPQPMQQAIDTSRYSLPQPLDDANDSIESWEKAVENARVQLEHQRGRLVNLQLLLKYGPASWRAHNEILSAMVQNTEEQVNVLHGDALHVNKERKIIQMRAEQELASSTYSHQTYMDLVDKNKRLEQEIMMMDNQS